MERYLYPSKHTKKKRRRRKIGLTFLLVLLLIIVLIIFHITIIVNPLIAKVSENKVKEFAVTAVIEAAGETIKDNYEYSNFVDISKDSSGSVSLIQINTMLLNVIARDIVKKSQIALNELKNCGIMIPIGTMSGIAFLSGKGADIKIKAFTICSVSMQIKSEFNSCGINQTKHSINIIVLAGISLILPGKNAYIETAATVPVTESIIAGKIPDFYFSA